MSPQNVIDYCLTKNGAYIDFPFGDDVVVVKVEKKVFAQIFTLKGEDKITLNCDMLTGQFLREMFPNIIVRGYHCPSVQQPYFNTMSPNGKVPDDTIIEMINHSYQTVVGKLPKYIRTRLVENEKTQRRKSYMNINNNLAAVCGLFCGTCPAYLGNACGGCLSDNCTCDCFAGFKDCAEMHNVVRCYECSLFPCEKINDFSTKHIENGICHHENVIKDLELMKAIGVEAWVEDQTEQHTCKKCGKLIVWNQKRCKC